MSTDARSYTWCSLGPLSEEGTSIAEDHAQTTGVIMLKGTISLDGVYRPTAGTIVNLAYSDGQNWIARLPLRLRVLSCFSDPIRKKTTVSVGCDFAYYEDRKEPQSLDTRDQNTNVEEAVWRAATPAISGAWLVGMILCILRLRYVGTIPLTNHYTIQEFDMSAGYVEELGKLLSSEGYVARMNVEGKVEFIYKEPAIAMGPLITQDDLIDINPINTGTLPGDAVYSKYRTLHLNKPEDDSEDNEKERKKRNWELDETFGTPEQYKHTWTEYLIVATGEFKQAKDSYGNLLYTQVYQNPANDVPLLEPIYEVRAIEREETINHVPYTLTKTTYDKKDRVKYRETIKNTIWGIETSETHFYYFDSSSVSFNSFGNDNESDPYDFEVFECDIDAIEENDPLIPQLPSKTRAPRLSDNGEIKLEITTDWAPIGPVNLALGLQRNFEQVKQGGFQYKSGQRTVSYERNRSSGITKTNTSTLVPFINTQDGSEFLSRIRDQRKPWEAVDAQAAIQLCDGGTETKIRTEREFGIQRRPSEAERTSEANRSVPDVEEKEEFAWATGSAASQTAIELSPPYVSDDRIVGGGGSYSVIRSDAAQKALNYARIENRLLFGHRNGNGIQVLPEMLPEKPLSLIHIRINNCTAAFIANGRTWNIDPSGVTVTCDALFWGAIDGSIGDAWFPLPPNATTLPAPVAISTSPSPKPCNAINIPNGFDFLDPDITSLFNTLPVAQSPVFAKSVTPGVLIKPFYETTKLTAGCGAGAIINSPNWVAQPPTELVAGAGAGAVITSITYLIAGAGAGVIITGSSSQVTSATFNITSTMGAVSHQGLVLDSFSPMIDWDGGTLTIIKNSSTSYIVELVPPAGLATDPATTFLYNVDSSSTNKNIASIVQAYTGTLTNVNNGLLIDPSLPVNNTEVAVEFFADGGPFTKLIHTYTLS